MRDSTAIIIIIICLVVPFLLGTLLGQENMFGLLNYENDVPVEEGQNEKQDDYVFVNHSINWTGCKNPTYLEMSNFIKKDQTDKKKWTQDYQCGDFSREVIKNSQDEGYIAGLVFLEMYIYEYEGLEINYGHDIICFNTSDKGLYFVEPQTDDIVSKSEMEAMYQDGEYYVGDSSEFVRIDLGTESWKINWYPRIEW